eukprot:scaffold7092_cov262-Pinguiococcus_pyrenoidosus.AAC.44
MRLGGVVRVCGAVFVQMPAKAAHLYRNGLRKFSLPLNDGCGEALVERKSRFYVFFKVSNPRRCLPEGVCGATAAQGAGELVVSWGRRLIDEFSLRHRRLLRGLSAFRQLWGIAMYGAKGLLSPCRFGERRRASASPLGESRRRRRGRTLQDPRRRWIAVADPKRSRSRQKESLGDGFLALRRRGSGFRWASATRRRTGRLPLPKLGAGYERKVLRGCDPIAPTRSYSPGAGSNLVLAFGWEPFGKE